MSDQGQSIATIDKERCLASAFEIGTKIANAKFRGRGFCYWHCDTNAGSGWNDEVCVPGSPIVFHTVANKFLTEMKREAFFCDRNVRALQELSLRLNEQPAWTAHSAIFPGDNEEMLEVFAERIRRSGERPEYAVGSVVVDPNGYWWRNAKGIGAPVKSLVQFAAEFERIDVILNLNFRTYQLQRGAGHSVEEPRAVLRKLNKKNWLVKITQRHGADKWLLAVGRNVGTADHKALGFHKLESDEGHFIMTMVEGKRQKDLLDEIG
jgi:hypothetical protein